MDVGAAAADFLGRRQIGQVGPVAFARVEDRSPAARHAARSLRFGSIAPTQLRHVVAEHFAKAARLEKVALHVDDQERAMLGRECELVRFGGKVDGRAHGIAAPPSASHRS